MKENLVIKHSNSSYINDFKIIGKVQSRLETYYTGGNNNANWKKESKTQFQNFRDNFGPVIDRFKRYSYCRPPWIDSEIWKTIESQDRSILPKSVRCGKVTFVSDGAILKRDTKDFRKQFNDEIDAVDSRSWDSFTRRERFLPNKQRKAIAKAGIEAFREIGAVSRNNGGKIPLERRLQSFVESTAKNTNSGFPFFLKKNNVSCIKDTICWLDGIVNSPNYYSLFNNPVITLPCFIFHRFQPSVDVDNRSIEIKIRPVWCQPQRIIALEQMFFGEILDNIKRFNVNTANPVFASGLTDFEISKKFVARFRHFLYLNSDLSNKVRKRSLYSMDYSKFDQTVSLYAHDLWFAMCKQSLKLSDKLSKLYDILRLYVKYTPFISKNCLRFKCTGVSSGSLLTSSIDTWWNNTLWILSESIYYVLNNTNKLAYFFENVQKDLYSTFDKLLESSLHVVSSPKNRGLCGDDVLIWTFKEHIALHQLFCKYFGMEIKIFNETTSYEDDIFFLGRYWERDNKQNQSDFYICCHLLFRTRFYSYDEVDFNPFTDINIHRTLSICTRLKSGLGFIDKYLKGYTSLHDFIKSNSEFTLLRDWPQNEGGYRKIKPVDFFNLEKT